jgi:adenylate kinase family enzyme
MKLHIIGIPGAGKTTLAEGISRLLSVAHHDLDTLRSSMNVGR